MALKYSTANRTNQMAAVNTDLGANAIIYLVSGTRPANVGASLTGTVVCVLRGHASGFGVASNGALTANAIASNTAVASNTVTHFRACNSSNTAVIDGDVGTSGSDLNLDNNIINSGQTVSITSFVLTSAGA